MNYKLVKRITLTLLGVVLPMVLLIAGLTWSTRRSYLNAAQAMGEEFAWTMSTQAKQTMEGIAKENWDTARTVAAALPDDFTGMTSAEQSAVLELLAVQDDTRSLSLYYYSQGGNWANSDGETGSMNYSSRTDISRVLAGTVSAALGGPQMESDYENESSTVAGTSSEVSGYCVYFTVPITNQSGTIGGAVSVCRDAYILSDAISGLSVGENSFTLVTDGTGTVIAASRDNEKPLIASESNLVNHEDAYTTLITQAQQDGYSYLLLQDNELGQMAVYAQSSDLEQLQQTDEGTASETDGSSVWVVLSCISVDTLRSSFQWYIREGSDSMVSRLMIALIFVLLLGVLTLYFVVSSKTEIRRKQHEHRQILQESLHTMLAILDNHDGSDSSHEFRMGVFSAELAAHMGMSEGEREKMYFEGALADIGIVDLKVDILRRLETGQATADDLRQFRRHVTVGGRILGRMTAIPDLNLGAMYHHQNYDGTGYCSEDVLPKKGQDIPVEARIIAVADFCDRHRELTQEQLIEALKKRKGHSLDPVITDIMIQLIEDGTMQRLCEDVENSMRIGRDPMTV